MKINIIAPSTSVAMGGGIRVIFRHANYLAENGHDVVVYVPMIFTIGDKFILKTSLANTFKRGTKIRWMDCLFKVKLAFQIKDKFIRNADIVIATAWYTAPPVNALSVSKGEKVYFIQDYEIWNQNEQTVDATYRMDMHRIVITQSLQNLLLQKFNAKSQVVYNGHNKDEYMSGDKNINNPKVVMMLWNSAYYKGGNEGLKILTRIHKKLGIHVILFSLEPKPDIPDHFEFHFRPTRDKLIELYQKADIYLFPSIQESWGLPVIEAMANKCAVVGMNTGCLKDLCDDGQQASIAECGNFPELENKLMRLLENEFFMKKIQSNGYNFSLQFSWEKQCNVFENRLINVLKSN